MFAASAGDIVILIPADMESDPLVDIPALVNHMEATDLDVVAGWRQGRKDGKVFASNIYNLVMRKLMAVPVHDGNWIKAMRRDVVESLPPLRSDWHRFILMIAAHQGFTIGEVQTYYQPRPAGSSKFGISRIPISLLDVIVLRFLLSFSQAPMRFFGGIGLAGMGVSLLTFLYLTVLYLATNTQKRPIFIAAGILAVISVILFVVGFLAELIVTQGERIYTLEKKLAAQTGMRTGSRAHRSGVKRGCVRWAGICGMNSTPETLPPHHAHASTLHLRRQRRARRPSRRRRRDTRPAA
ncbi:MAG: hypothetical protein R2854_22415 [Caldilineaceae bacterium]